MSSCDDFGDLFGSSSEDENAPLETPQILATAAVVSLDLEKPQATQKMVSLDDDEDPQALRADMLRELESLCADASPCFRVKQLMLSAVVLQENDCSITTVEEDKEWLVGYYDFPDDEDDDGVSTHSWVLRLEFCSARLKDVGVSISMISRGLGSKFKRFLHVIYSGLPAPAPVQVLRVRVRMLLPLEDPRTFLLELLLKITELPLRTWVPSSVTCAKRAKVIGKIPAWIADACCLSKEVKVAEQQEQQHLEQHASLPLDALMGLVQAETVTSCTENLLN